MCGICGIFGAADEALVEIMTKALAHRGHDGHGVYVKAAGRVSLGHRRLAIIDLSAAGKQPMSYAGRYWITFNGEIYNYEAVRAELEKLGHHFATHTDTEVILAAYAQWGAASVTRLRGMFALAIYDAAPEASCKLFLARDRFGIKPLYYTRAADKLLFASELKSLLASGLVSRIIDKQAVWDYLSLGSVPQPRTILQNVYSLLAGHYACVNAQGELTIERYWDVAADSARNFPNASTMARADAVTELRRLLHEATRLHLIADVPVGAFLSGGIDSTAVVGLMSQYVHTPIKTYAIGFEAQHSALDELKWARLAAEHYHTDHHEVVITSADVARQYDELVSAIDQPSLDGTNTYLVSKATRQGVVVSLSGLGGDELFAGYTHFQTIQATEAFAARLPASLRSALQRLAAELPSPLAQRLGFYVADSVTRHAAIRCLADDRRKAQMLTPQFLAGWSPHLLTDLYTPWVHLAYEPINRTSYVELNGYMQNMLLRDTDAMSMAHALEVRPVLLDHVLAEFTFALPGRYKLEGQQGKAIFLDALRDLLPPPILARGKMGFGMPLFYWLSSVLRERAVAAFHSSAAQALFTEPYRQQAIAHLQNPTSNDTRLWAYVMLLEWLQFHECKWEI